MDLLEVLLHAPGTGGHEARALQPVHIVTLFGGPNF